MPKNRPKIFVAPHPGIFRPDPKEIESIRLHRKEMYENMNKLSLDDFEDLIEDEMRRTEEIMTDQLARIHEECNRKLNEITKKRNVLRDCIDKAMLGERFNSRSEAKERIEFISRNCRKNI